MNQTYAHTNYATPTTRSKTQDQESLLSKIVVGLKARLINRHPNIRARYQHQSFMDANLLDDVMGKEISRTLRR